MIPLPAWAVDAIGGALLLGAVAAGAEYKLHRAYDDGYRAAKAERKADDDAALRIAAAQAQVDQKALSDKFLLAQRDRFKEAQDAQATIDTLRARVRAGATVLRLPAGSAVCPGAAPGSAAAGPGPVAEGGSVQLVPGSADAFISIAGRIAAGVRRENDLIDAYERCRAAANEPYPIRAVK